MDPHPGSQDLSDPTDPDPKHCNSDMTITTTVIVTILGLINLLKKRDFKIFLISEWFIKF